jgi:hypothetical protein
MGREDPGDSHPVMNEWGGAWAVPSRVRVVWAIPGLGHPWATYVSPKLFLLLACLILDVF